jgi:putative Mg2+ transporter-C (MgtC) family protein
VGPAITAAGGQWWTELGELGLAFGLTTLIGLERSWSNKAAGLRTHTLVGVGAALFVIVSKYGFSDVTGPSVSFDPSRVAAQVVTGIGFLGGGLIFVRGDAVRGLTTAAIIWMTTAIGMACGAGLGRLALAGTVCHFLVVAGYPRLLALLPRSRHAGFVLRVVYEDGRGILREILAECTRRGLVILRVSTRQLPPDARDGAPVVVLLGVDGQPAVDGLVVALSEIPGVLEVRADDAAHGHE